MTSQAIPPKITCVLPGLYWPGQDIASRLAHAAVSLPTLAAIVGRATIRHAPAQRFEPWLAAQFGVESPAWARLRRMGEVGMDAPASSGNWLCADPVSLAFSRDALLLRGPQGLDITAEESAAMIVDLNRQFADVGRFTAASPTRWYLHTENPIGVHFHPLSDVQGRPVALFQAEGDNARYWARLANEIQVMLHNHPVNVARAERGAPLVNALWLWGESADGPAPVAPGDCLIGDDIILRGLATATRCFWLSNAMATTPAHGRSAHSWWLDSRLQEACLQGDTEGWLNALVQIDMHGLQPLWQAFRAGRIGALEIISPSEKGLITLSLGRESRWKFWRLDASMQTVGELLWPQRVSQTSGSPA